MSKIFISHSSKDKDKINKLVERLKSLECDVFYSSDALTNKIGYGSDFYEVIKKEISQSDAVLFMVSQNFYNSVPSLIEVGIAYSLNKNMIPIGFKSGNYIDDLKGVFNLNKRLAYLDNEECVFDLLFDLGVNKDPKLIFRYTKEITEKLINIEKKDVIDSEIETAIEADEGTPKNNLDEIVKKLNKLNDLDYIFLTYIVKAKEYKFVFENEPDYWPIRFSEWLNMNGLDEKVSSNYQGFLNHLEIKKLLTVESWFYSIDEDTLDALHIIYDRDKSKIDSIIEKYSNDEPDYSVHYIDEYSEEDIPF